MAATTGNTVRFPCRMGASTLYSDVGGTSPAGARHGINSGRPASAAITTRADSLFVIYFLFFFPPAFRDTPDARGRAWCSGVSSSHTQLNGERQFPVSCVQKIGSIQTGYVHDD